MAKPSNHGRKPASKSGARAGPQPVDPDRHIRPPYALVAPRGGGDQPIEPDPHVQPPYDLAPLSAGGFQPIDPDPHVKPPYGLGVMHADGFQPTEPDQHVPPPYTLERPELQKLPLRVASKRGGYGWVRDLPDSRDLAYAGVQQGYSQGLPDNADLREGCPPTYDQGQLGSCTANAIAAAIEFDLIRQDKKAFTPSRLFIYFNERVIEHTVYLDSGAQIRDGIKSVAQLGAPPEKFWPYDVKKFWETPPAEAFSKAKQDLLKSYYRVPQDAFQLRSCLADGFPFVFGFTAYESFESAAVAKKGVVPMPNSKERMLGGHAVAAVGYDEAKRVFIVRNSWGPGWGDKGYGFMPYEYLLTPHLAGDFWTLRSIGGRRKQTKERGAASSAS